MVTNIRYLDDLMNERYVDEKVENYNIYRISFEKDNKDIYCLFHEVDGRPYIESIREATEKTTTKITNLGCIRFTIDEEERTFYTTRNEVMDFVRHFERTEDDLFDELGRKYPQLDIKRA